MSNRRDFIKFGIGFLAGIGLSAGSLFSSARWASAKAGRISWSDGTKREGLIQRVLGSRDTKNPEITPLKDFGIMGLSDHEVNLVAWRLEISGHLRNQLSLTYPKILTLPSFDKNVVLICPGFFVNHGRWTGVSMKALLQRAGMKKDVTHVTFSGPEGSHEKVERFPVEDVLSNKVFLAYGVNGETLPKKHGFPLRVVAEGYSGDDWVKYVYKMTLQKR